MSAMRYLDFDLQITRAADGYRAQVIDSPAGQGAAEFALPWSELELENLLLKLGGARRVVRGEATADNVTYSIVNVEVDIDGDGQRAASGERFVRIRVRVTNNNAGSGGKLVGQNTCRLIIDGVPQSSQRFWSDVLRSNDSTEGTLLFSVPENVTAADLQVGEPGGETATISLTINVSAP